MFAWSDYLDEALTNMFAGRDLCGAAIPNFETVRTGRRSST